MKKLILASAVIITLLSCKKPTQEIQPTIQVVTDTIENFRIVKHIKEDTETKTSYHYKYDWLNGKFRQQPKISSETKYYIIFTDGSMEETTKEKGMFYEKGDTIKYYTYVYK